VPIANNYLRIAAIPLLDLDVIDLGVVVGAILPALQRLQTEYCPGNAGLSREQDFEKELPPFAD
jgi:hypothetical protein